MRGHAHLNVLLQSAGALIAKKWVQLIDQEIKKQQLDAQIIAWVHDEVQIQVKGDADHVGNLTRRMAKEAGSISSSKSPSKQNTQSDAHGQTPISDEKRKA